MTLQSDVSLESYRIKHWISSRNQRENIPDDRTDHDCFLSAHDVRDVTGYESRNPGATCHRGSDASLDSRCRTIARCRALIEVTLVRISADNGTHGRNIKTEQTTTNDGDCRDDVDLETLNVNI
jgi:hypothetical protein